MATDQTRDDQPRSGVGPKKKRRDRLIQRALGPPTWGLGLGDDVWGSRLAQPHQHRGTDAEAMRTWPARRQPSDDPAPKALACYGLLVRHHPQPAEPMGRRCVGGRPVSAVTIALLAWCAARLAAQGVTALLWIWDHASWHKSPAVRRGRRSHNQPGKPGAVGVRIVACQWSSTSPWLNPIEPTWVHGKRAVSEPDRRLRAEDLETRV